MAIENAAAAEGGGRPANVSDQDPRVFRAAVESSFGAVLITDTVGVIEYVNPSFEELTGYRACDVIGRLASELSTGEDLDQLIWAAMTADGQWRGEIRNKRPDGEEYCVLTSVRPLRSDKGAITHYISVSIDISQRVRVEEELAEREAHWRALVENAADLIAIVDRNGVISRLNRDPVGSTIDEIVGKTVYDFARSDTHTVWREALAKVFTEGERVDFEVQAADGNGRVEWCATSLAPVWTDGVVTAAVVSERDITALKEAEERMRAIAEAIADIIVVVDEDGVLLEVLAPRTVGGLLQRRPADIRNRRVHEFLPQDQAEWALEVVRATIASGRPREDEALFDLPNGPAWLLCRTAPMTLSDGRTVAVVHTVDISERKRLEEEMRQLHEATGNLMQHYRLRSTPVVDVEVEAGVKRASGYGLTFREVTVLSLISRGKSDKEIASQLGLSPFTVNKHSSNIVRKLGARSRSQAVARAVREDII